MNLSTTPIDAGTERQNQATGSDSNAFGSAGGGQPLQQLCDAALLSQFLGMASDHDESLGDCLQALSNAGGLRPLIIASDSQLQQLTGFNSRQRKQLLAAVELFRRYTLQALVRGQALTSPGDSVHYLKTCLRDRRREVFIGLFLDTRHRVMVCEELFKGSIDGACVYPRVVADKALRYGAAAVIVAHNHPSGVAEPSLADQAITRRLREALDLLEIRLLDHFVIGDGEPVSMASRGML